jgi:hypothetical protein
MATKARKDWHTIGAYFPLPPLHEIERAAAIEHWAKCKRDSRC